MNLNEYSRLCAQRAQEKGFFMDSNNIFSVPVKLALIVSELSEALAEHRKPLVPDDTAFHLADVLMDMKEGKYFDQQKFDAEIADTFIRLFDLCGQMGIDIQSAVDKKLDFNQSRPHKHGKRY